MSACTCTYVCFRVLQGYEQRGKECLKKVQASHETFCPKGCEASGYGKDLTCNKEEKWTTAFCPQGYEQNGKVCSKVQTTPYEYVCPRHCQTDASQKKLTCFTTKTNEEYKCPAGTVANGKYECTKFDVVAHQSVCSKGCEWNKAGKCVEQFTDYEFYCPAGTVTEGKRCTKWESSVVLARCPSSCRFEKNACFTVDSWTEKVCPKGTEIVNNQCVKYDVVAEETECPKGCSKTADNKCSKSQAYTEEFCPKGYETEGAKCWTWNKQPQSARCPKPCHTEVSKAALIFVKESCVKDVFYNEEQCPKNTQWNSKTNACEKYESSAVKERCPAGTGFVKGACQKVWSVPAQAVKIVDGKKLRA